MLKDTKSLGNNKAPACESRGFVHKKRGVHFDTPPLFLYSRDHDSVRKHTFGKRPCKHDGWRMGSFSQK